jgi:hypothetical protein
VLGDRFETDAKALWFSPTTTNGARMELELKDVVTMVAAAVGAVLGIYNFFHGRTLESVRLRVVSKAASFRGKSADGRDFYLSSEHEYSLDGLRAADTLSMEIINLSKFAVTVDDVGLVPRSPTRMALAYPILHDGGAWPRKLEPRESVTFYFDSTRLLELKSIGTVKKANASTVCGHTAFGTSGALRDLVRIAAGKK